MKTTTTQNPIGIVQPPKEARREPKKDQRAAAQLSDPVLRFHELAGAQDSRPTIAREGAMQRIRARQTEARTAELSHARKQRRAPVKTAYTVEAEKSD